MSRSVAFLVGVDQFADTSFSPLRFCQRDVAEMDRVLNNREISDFETVIMMNEPHYTILSRIERMLGQLEVSDKVLLYFAGHGKRARLSGDLYLVASDTFGDALNSTGISVERLLRILRSCSCRQRLVILDCCYSGAVGQLFNRGEVSDEMQVLAENTGTYILAASTGTQTAAERENEAGGGNGVFTRFLIEGLESGDASLGSDGEAVTVDSLFSYARTKVVMNALQEPKKFVLDGAGDFVLARSQARRWDGRRREVRGKFLNLLQDNVIGEDDLAVVLRLTKRTWSELDAEEREVSGRLLDVHGGTLSAMKFFASVASWRDDAGPRKGPPQPEPISAKRPTEPAVEIPAPTRVELVSPMLAFAGATTPRQIAEVTVPEAVTPKDESAPPTLDPNSGATTGRPNEARKWLGIALAVLAVSGFLIWAGTGGRSGSPSPDSSVTPPAPSASTAPTSDVEPVAAAPSSDWVSTGRRTSSGRMILAPPATAPYGAQAR